MSRILPFRWSCLAVAILLSLSAQVSAQDAFKQFKQLDTTPRMPKLKAFVAPGTSTSPVATLHDVALDAKLTPDAQPIQQGLSWYVFSPTPGGDGKLPLLASSSGGSAAFHLAAGDYFVNVSFGRAGVTKKLTVPASGETQKQVIVLDAGGMLLNAVSGSDVRIPPDELSFSIYANDVKEDGTRGLIMSDVKPNTLVGLSAGTYHVVSEYGNVNAVIRADIQIEAGHITQATIQHRAAKITLKLVADAGGEAMADTAWSILTAAGDIVGESVSAFPTLILAEGKYSVVARNKDKIYQRDFTVAAGRNTDVEVLMSGQQPQDAPDAETDQQAEPIPQVQQQPSPTQVQSPNQVQSAPQTAPQEQEPLPAGDTGTSMD